MKALLMVDFNTEQGVCLNPETNEVDIPRQEKKRPLDPVSIFRASRFDACRRVVRQREGLKLGHALL